MLKTITSPEILAEIEKQNVADAEVEEAEDEETEKDKFDIDDFRASIESDD